MRTRLADRECKTVSGFPVSGRDHRPTTRCDDHQSAGSETIERETRVPDLTAAAEHCSARVHAQLWRGESVAAIGEANRDRFARRKRFYGLDAPGAIPFHAIRRHIQRCALNV